MLLALSVGPPNIRQVCTSERLGWILHHHVLISLGIVLLAALVIWGVGPASFAVTHINMQNCGSLYSALGPQPAGGKVNSQAV